MAASSGVGCAIFSRCVERNADHGFLGVTYDTSLLEDIFAKGTVRGVD